MHTLRILTVHSQTAYDLVWRHVGCHTFRSLYIGQGLPPLLIVIVEIRKLSPSERVVWPSWFSKDSLFHSFLTASVLDHFAVFAILTILTSFATSPLQHFTPLLHNRLPSQVSFLHASSKRGSEKYRSSLRFVDTKRVCTLKHASFIPPHFAEV